MCKDKIEKNEGKETDVTTKCMSCERRKGSVACDECGRWNNYRPVQNKDHCGCGSQKYLSGGRHHYPWDHAGGHPDER